MGGECALLRFFAGLPSTPGGTPRETTRIFPILAGAGAVANQTNLISSRARTPAGQTVNLVPYPWFFAYATATVAPVTISWRRFDQATAGALFRQIMDGLGVAGPLSSAIILPNDDKFGMTFDVVVGIGGLATLSLVGIDDFWQAVQAMRIAAAAGMEIGGSGGGIDPVPTPPV